MSSNSILLDGKYTRGFYSGRPRIDYPFQENGDYTSIIIVREWVQSEATYQRGRLGIDRDPRYAAAYIIGETSPEPIGIGDVIRVTRTFATVPADQITYGSRVITKPAFPSNNYAGAYVDSTSATATANVWSPTTLATISAYITGGTLTITYRTSTTGTLNATDSNATIAAAINALADMIADATTVSVSNLLTTAGTLTITRATGGADFTGDFTWSPSLTPTGVTSVNSASVEATFLALRASINYLSTAHGLTTGNSVMVQSGTSGAGTVKTATVVDANNFTVANDSATTPPGAYWRRFLRTYTPGTDRVRIRKTQRFYLPGYTTGITTPADIPLPTLLMNDGDFLAAIASNTMGFTDYDASELSRWNDWPIYTQTFEALDLASV